MKKILIVVTVLATALLLITSCNSNESDYENAMSLYDKGAYQVAGDAFEELGDYEDSARMAQVCRNAQAAITNVEDLIYDIGTVTFDSLPQIEIAEQAYDALSEKDRNLVANIDTLREARSECESSELQLTPENYDQYLDIFCSYNLTDGIDIGEAIDLGWNIGEAAYQSIESILTVSGKEGSNYKYNDVVVTVEVAGSYVPFSKAGWAQASKDSEGYIRDNLTVYDVTLTAQTDVLGDGSDYYKLNFPEGYWVISFDGAGYAVMDVSGSISHAS